MATRSGRGDRLEQRHAGLRPFGGLGRELTELEPAARVEAKAEVPGLGLRQPKVVPPAAQSQRIEEAPAFSIRRYFRQGGSSDTGRSPVENEPAEHSHLAEIHREHAPCAGARAPCGRRVSIHGMPGRAAATGVRRARGRGRGVGAHRVARLEGECVEPDRRGAARPGGDRDLDGGDVPDVPAPLRAPGERNVAARNHDALPRGPGGEVAPDRPPDVRARRVDELELEGVGGCGTPDPEGELVILGKREVDGAPGHCVPRPPVEIEVEPQRRAGTAGAAADLQRHAFARHRGPERGAIEIVDDALLRPEGNGPHREQAGAQPAHPLTLPAITPWM